MQLCPSSRPDLPAAADDVFVARELLDTDRAARVEFVGRDPDLGAHAELATVRELGRCVVQDDGAIDGAEETFRRLCIGRYDRFGMRGILATSNTQ